jgi:protein-tyrosine-phosphatase
MNVLFVCDDCSLCLMAQSILTTLGDGRFRAYSAGIAPACAPSRAVIEFLTLHHMRVEGLRPSPLERFRAGDGPRMDFIITLAEVDQQFADWPGAPFIAHWDVLYDGDDMTREPTQRDAFWTLMRRIKIFASLPQGSLNRRVLERRAPTLDASYL